MSDPADLEQLAVRLDQSGDYRILRRVPVVTRYADDDPATLKHLGLIVDIETTGLDPATDRIVELGACPSTSPPRACSMTCCPAMRVSRIPATRYTKR